MYKLHEIYQFIDGDRVDVTLQGNDQARIDRFKDYLVLGMAMALHENSDLLSELCARCQEVADDE